MMEEQLIMAVLRANIEALRRLWEAFQRILGASSTWRGMFGNGHGTFLTLILHPLQRIPGVPPPARTVWIVADISVVTRYIYDRRVVTLSTRCTGTAV